MSDEDLDKFIRRAKLKRFSFAREALAIALDLKALKPRSIEKDRDRLIHILVVHCDMPRKKAEEAADLFLHDKKIQEL